MIMLRTVRKSTVSPLIAVLQTEEAFAAALEALRRAGVQLVPLDMSLVMDMAARDLPDELFYTYEMPRELSR